MERGCFPGLEEVLIPSLDDACADSSARGQQTNIAVLQPSAQGDWVEASTLPLGMQ